MTTFVDFPSTVTAATLSGSNGIGVAVETGTPNKIVVSVKGAITGALTSLTCSNDINVAYMNVGAGNGIHNTRFGYNALPSSQGASSDNIAIGNSACQYMTTAKSNIGIGSYALAYNGSKNNNIAIGNFALYFHNNGGNNVGIGTSVMNSGYNLYENTAIGYRAGTVYTCSGSTALGAYAGNGPVSANYTTAIGWKALYSTNYSNSCGLGAEADVTNNNQVQLGNSFTSVYAYGAIQDRSDARDKTDIQDINFGLNFITKLRPVNFKWDFREDYELKDYEKVEYIDENGENKTKLELKITNLPRNGSKKRNRNHHGFIAQEVKQIMNDLDIDFGGYQDHSIKGGKDVLSLGYTELIAPMVKSIQELKAENDDLKQKLTDVLSRLSALENK